MCRGQGFPCAGSSLGEGQRQADPADSMRKPALSVSKRNRDAEGLGWLRHVCVFNVRSVLRSLQHHDDAPVTLDVPLPLTFGMSL